MKVIVALSAEKLREIVVKRSDLIGILNCLKEFEDEDKDKVMKVIDGLGVVKLESIICSANDLKFVLFQLESNAGAIDKVFEALDDAKLGKIIESGSCRELTAIMVVVVGSVVQDRKIKALSNDKFNSIIDSVEGVVGVWTILKAMILMRGFISKVSKKLAGEILKSDKNDLKAKYDEILKGIVSQNSIGLEEKVVPKEIKRPLLTGKAKSNLTNSQLNL